MEEVTAAGKASRRMAGSVWAARGGWAAARAGRGDAHLSGSSLSTATLASSIHSGLKMAAVTTEPMNPPAKKYGSVVITLENVLLPQEKLSPSPSQQDGLDADIEMDLRILGCELIQTGGILLRLPQVSVDPGRAGPPSGAPRGSPGAVGCLVPCPAVGGGAWARLAAWGHSLPILHGQPLGDKAGCFRLRLGFTWASWGGRGAAVHGPTPACMRGWVEGVNKGLHD